VKKHVKIYCDYFGHGEQSFIACEVCGSVAVDIHHIVYRSQLGKNNIENLMALCRDHHNAAHSGKLTKEYLTKIHRKNLR